MAALRLNASSCPAGTRAGVCLRIIAAPLAPRRPARRALGAAALAGPGELPPNVASARAWIAAYRLRTLAGGNGAAAAPAIAAPSPSPFAALAGTFAALSAVLALAPAAVAERALGAAASATAAPAAASLTASLAGYGLLACVALLALRDAAAHDRLGSDTYKRLNLGLFYQAVVFTAIQVRALVLGLPPGFNPAFAAATGALLVTTAFVALRSYAASNAGSFSLPDVLRGFACGVLDCLRPKNAAAGFYGLQALCSLAGFAVLAVAGATPLFAAPVGAATAFLAQAVGAGLLLVGVAHYVLFDAANRGRLGATTFRQLNLALGSMSALQGYHFWRLRADGAIALDPQVWAGLMTGFLLTGVVCDALYFLAKK